MVHTAHYAQQNALKMSGVFVKLTPSDFQNLINKHDNLAIVFSKSSFFGTSFSYVTAHKGLTFFCKTKDQLSLPSKHEVFSVAHLSLPVM
jgi:hypothetical protein